MGLIPLQGGQHIGMFSVQRSHQDLTLCHIGRFQAEYLVAQESAGNTGVSVAGVQHGSATGRLVYDPTNPVASKAGYVRMPDIDLGEQMSDLIMAQRGFEANSKVITTSDEVLQDLVNLKH